MDRQSARNRNLPSARSSMRRIARNRLTCSERAAPLLRLGGLTNQFRLALTVRSAVFMEHIVKPHRRRLGDIGMLPGVPRQIGLTAPFHQSPVDGSYAILFRDGQNRIE